jgi:hypothetical protein
VVRRVLTSSYTRDFGTDVTYTESDVKMTETITERMIRLREFETAARTVMESMLDDITDLAYAFPRDGCKSELCACSGACMAPIAKEKLDKLSSYYDVVYGYKPPEKS